MAKPWPCIEGIRLVKSGAVAGDTWGHSSYAFYEACRGRDLNEDPYLVVWLHGADGGCDMRNGDLVNMQQRLGRRTFFFAPKSPQPDSEGYRFFWGVRYTKAQNKGDKGFIFGELHKPYLEAFCETVRELSEEVGALAILVCGYSMGGFGAWQLGSHKPELFTALVPIAGYGMGTFEKGGCYNAPQPQSETILKSFLAFAAPKLAKVPLVLAIHAKADTVSSFSDTKHIVETIQHSGGNADLVIIEKDAADSDPGKRKVKAGHNYFYHSLLNESSESVLWSRLRIGLDNLDLQRRGNQGTSSMLPTGTGAERHRSRSPRRASSDGDPPPQRLSLIGRLLASI